MNIQIQYNILGGVDVINANTDKIIGVGEFIDDKLILNDFVTGNTNIIFNKDLSGLIDYYFSLKEPTDN